MPLSRPQAKDEMLARVKEAVDSIDAGSRPTVSWEDNKPVNTREPGSKWCVVSVRHGGEPQASLSGADGKKRWRSGGFLSIQCFTPSGDGTNLADLIGPTIRNAFRGYTSSGGIEFRNPSAQEVGTSGSWFQVNVIVEFEYDEFM